MPSSAPPSRRPAARAARGAQAPRKSAGAAPPSRPRGLNYPRAGARGPLRWWPSWRLLGLLALLGVVVVLALVVVAYRLVDVPTEETAQARYRTSNVFYSDGSTQMATFSKDSVDRVPLSPSEIPDTVKEAIIASEDRSFRSNRGVSVTGIGRAVYGVVTGKDLGGGSTITQQYVKNVYGDDSPTYTRKLREAIIAVKVDQQVSKPEILSRYLNTIYFGRGAYGIQTAARQYFGVDAAQLTHEQAALLVGVVPAPTAYDPRNDATKAQERYAYVMDAMVETGAVDQAEASANPTMPETVEPQPDQTYDGPNGYVLSEARKELERAGISEEQLDTEGLNIVLTIDRNLQDEAVATMQDPDVYPTSRPDSVQAGLISIDPADGSVKAMYAGADYATRPLDTLTQEKAQAGSTFKPFALVAALEQGKTLSTTLNGDSPSYPPGYPNGLRNFGNEDEGRVNLVQATAQSVNTAYVQLNGEIGPEHTVEVAERAGLPAEDVDRVKDQQNNVLGTASVRPWDLATAYATYAARGERHTTHLVASVSRIDDGSPVFTADTTGEQVISQSVMADATTAMQAVIQQGSGRKARALGRPVAGKTGTTTDNKAAWFSAFTPQLSTTVVMFNPDPETGAELQIPPFGGVKQIIGGGFPAAIWTDYMEKALAGTEELDFPAPTRSVQRPRSSASSSSTSRPAPSRSSSPSSSSSSSTTAQDPSPSESSTSSEGGDGEGGDGDGDGDGDSTPSPSSSEPSSPSPTTTPGGRSAPGVPAPPDQQAPTG